MKKRQNNSARASALQITLSVALLSVSAILFASSFRAAPTAPQAGFYPPLPQAVPNLQPAILNPSITVILPTATFDTSVPIATVIIQPVTTTLIDPTTTGGLDYVGFQGDFTFDETVVKFVSATPVSAAGLTVTTGGWSVLGAVLAGPGPIRTLRVLATANDTVTGLSGSGTLFNLNMLRVSCTPGAFPAHWSGLRWLRGLTFNSSTPRTGMSGIPIKPMASSP